MPDLTTPYDDYQKQLQDIRQDAGNLIADLSEAQGNWRPETGGWSIAQCLDHLKVVDSGYTKALTQGIAQANAKNLRPDSAPMSYNFFERKFIATLEPPPKMRLKAPKSVLPPSELDFKVVAEKFLAKNQALLELIPAASQVHPKKAKIRSPLAKFLKLSVGAAYALIAAHDRRHLWQAWQVRNNGNFPK